MYNQNSFAVLQHILMLKYLGFSLDEISHMLENETDIHEHLSQQRKLLDDRKKQLEQMISTIELVQNSSGDAQWDALLHLLNIMSDEQKIIEQYQTSSNLEKRINIHSFSTGSQNWFDWVYERLQIQSGQRILELGCGNGMLWAHNADKLPENLEITLTDRSEAMLAKAQKTLEPFDELFKLKNISIKYQTADANKLLLPAKTYDLIVANHMLYHVTNLDACLRAVSKALTPGGFFCCSTIGDAHMRELHELIAEFDSDIVIEIPQNKLTTSFRLENGMDPLKKYFKSVTREIQDNDLLVDDADAIYNYVYSYPGNAPYVLDHRGDEFRQMLQEKINKEGAIYIHKSTGMFMCR